VGGRPKDWSSFPKKDQQYVPPFRAMQKSGEANLLPTRVAADCEKAEVDALSAGSRLQRWLEQTYLPAIRSYLTTLVPAGKNAIVGRRYRELQLSWLCSFNQEELETFIQELERDQLGVGVEFATERGRTDKWFIYSDYAPQGDWTPILREAWRRGQADPEAAKVNADLKIAAASLDKLIVVLKARIRDPHPLIESIRRSLSDAFRSR